MTPRPLLLLALPLLLTAGCVTPVAAPTYEVDRRVVYQRIANALPLADFGWGTAPGVVEMAKSVHDAGPAPKPPPLVANERGFRIRMHVFRPRSEWIPYAAITQARYTWRTFPNVLFIPLLVVPLQWVDAEVVLDTDKIDGFDSRLRSDLKRLEAISREIGLGGPWSFAQNVKAKQAEDAAELGAGKLVLHFGYVIPGPPYVPLGGQAEETAVAFAWAAAHPDAPKLKPKQPAKAGEEPAEGSPKKP